MVGEIAELEDFGLTSFNGHTKVTAIHKETISENDLKTSRQDFPQLKIERRIRIEMGRRGRDAIWPGPTPLEQQSKGRKDITTLEASPEEREV